MSEPTMLEVAEQIIALHKTNCAALQTCCDIDRLAEELFAVLSSRLYRVDPDGTVSLIQCENCLKNEEAP